MAATLVPPPHICSGQCTVCKKRIMKNDTPFYRVTIEYKDDTTGHYDCTDSPYIGSDWISLYLHTKRTSIPAGTIRRISYDIVLAQQCTEQKSGKTSIGFK